MRLFRNRKPDESIRAPRITTQNEPPTFRRNRTLTGTSSDQIRAAGEDRAQIRSPRMKEHDLRSHRRTLLMYLVGVVMVIAALLLLLSQLIGTVSVKVHSAEPLATTPDVVKYRRLIDDYFRDRPVERLRFALNHEELQAYMREKAPEVATIQISTAGLAAAKADMSFRVPVVAWQLPAQRSYVDGEGHAFTQNYYSEPSLTVKDESGIDPSTGVIVSDRFLQFMGRVIALSNESGALRVTGVTIPRNTTREIDFNLEGRAYVVKTQLGRDPASQAADIINAVQYIESKGLKPAYVDVRVASRAAYR